MKQMNLLEELIVDNFAGGGGASTGIELATGRPLTQEAWEELKKRMMG